MPLFGPDGRVIMGTGNGVVSVDGVQIDLGGGANFIRAGVACYQTPEGQIVANGEVLDEQGGNELGAGGDIWVGWSPGRGVFGPGKRDGIVGLWSVQGSGSGSVSRQGDVAGMTVAGGGLVIRRGQSVQFVAAQSATVNDGVWCWADQGRVWVDTPLLQHPIDSLVPFAGRIASNGLDHYRCHVWRERIAVYRVRPPLNEPIMGWLVGNQPEFDNEGSDFYTDILIDPENVIHVVSSRGAGEAPGELQHYRIDPTSQMVNLSAVPPLPGRPVVSLPEYAEEPSEHQTGTVPVLEGSPRAFRVNLSDHPDNPPDNFVMSVPAWGDAEVCITAALESPHRTIVFYLDAPECPGWLVAHAKDANARGLVAWLSWQCYPQQGRPLDDTKHDIQGAFIAAKASGFPFCPWFAMYRGINQNALGQWIYVFTLPDVLAIFDWSWRQFVAHGGMWINVFIWTRAGGRDGIVKWPQLKELASRLLTRQIEADLPPVAVPPPSTPKPSVWTRFLVWLRNRFR